MKCINIEIFAIPNCIEFNTTYPRVPINTPTKCEVDLMNIWDIHVQRETDRILGFNLVEKINSIVYFNADVKGQA